MRVIVTGGAGFIGSNASERFCARGDEVLILDNLSRPGAEANLAWLRERRRFGFEQLDVRDGAGLARAVAEFRPDAVLHLAAQVAVTTSVVDPRADFEVNALGTFNVLEAVRLHAKDAAVLYASTNKVYGGLEHLGTEEHQGRYRLTQRPLGVSEEEPLDFHSPYGCSKGAADQYVRDYARIYGLRTVSLRQSCIYGQRQFGIEDQGWVAWFTIAAELGREVTIYGDGKQVRDVLHVDDLCDAYEAALARIDRAKGEIFNLGGGPENTLCLLELLAHLGELSGRPVARRFADWRPGDQPVFVSDVRKAEAVLGWRPRIGAREGVERLHRWVRENVRLFKV